MKATAMNTCYCDEIGRKEFVKKLTQVVESGFARTIYKSEFFSLLLAVIFQSMLERKIFQTM
jgi:hypothetical protein